MSVSFLAAVADRTPPHAPVTTPFVGPSDPVSSSGDDTKDEWYELGTKFLQLPARATRDGAAETGEQVLGTAVHVELFGRKGEQCAPPYLALAIEPSTGAVVSCRRVVHTTGFEGYEDVLWGFIEDFIARNERMSAGDSALHHKPATLTSTDGALADYIFGLLQGCGMDVVHVDGKTQRAQARAEI